MEANDMLIAIGMLEEYLPVLEKAAPLLAAAGKQIKPLMELSADAFVDLTVRSIDRYEAAGMSREEAILLSLNTQISIHEALKNIKKS